MDFIEELRNLSARITRQKDVIQTEEATKNAFVMPFIKIFGSKTPCFSAGIQNRPVSFCSC